MGCIECSSYGATIKFSTQSLLNTTERFNCSTILSVNRHQTNGLYSITARGTDYLLILGFCSKLVQNICNCMVQSMKHLSMYGI